MITDERLTASGAVRRCAVGLPRLRHKSKGERQIQGEGVEVRVPARRSATLTPLLTSAESPNGSPVEYVG
jgi:hypothetical protein